MRKLKPLDPESLLKDNASPLAHRLAALLIAIEGKVEPDAREDLWAIILGISRPQLDETFAELKRLGYMDEKVLH